MLERRGPKGAIPATENGAYGLPEEIVLPTSTIPFLGGEFSCPNQTEAYLRMMYGDFEKIGYTYVATGPVKSRALIDSVDVPSARYFAAPRCDARKEAIAETADRFQSAEPCASARNVLKRSATSLGDNVGRPRPFIEPGRMRT